MFKKSGAKVMDYVRIDSFVGNLWGWGANSQGQLGDGTISHKSSPIQTVAGGTAWKQVVSGRLYTAAIKTNGELWSWGINSLGMLGDGTPTERSSPVQIVTGGTNWKQVSIGQYHSAAIKTNGELWNWGYNNNGQLGTSDVTDRSSPIQTVAGGTNWKHVSCGVEHVAAIKTDGTLWSWGNNLSGQLGDNSTVKKSSPVQTIALGNTWKQVSAGANGAAAIKTNGELWLWGANDSGQLGDNTRTVKSSPVQTIAGGTDWKNVSFGGGFTFAIKTDGTLWGWGYNANGALGDGTVAHKSSPVQTVAGGTNWKQVSASSFENYTAAIKTDGTLWNWGNNTYGQLGDSSLVHKSSPIQTVAGGTTWKEVSCANGHTAAIKYQP